MELHLCQQLCRYTLYVLLKSKERLLNSQNLRMKTPSIIVICASRLNWKLTKSWNKLEESKSKEITCWRKKRKIKKLKLWTIMLIWKIDFKEIPYSNKRQQSSKLSHRKNWETLQFTKNKSASKWYLLSM